MFLLICSPWTSPKRRQFYIYVNSFGGLFGRAYFGICCCCYDWLQCLIDQVVQSLCSAMMIVLISKLIRSTFGNWSTCWWTSFESASRKYKILQSVGGCVWINKHAIIWLFSFTSLLTGGTFRPDSARSHFGSFLPVKLPGPHTGLCTVSRHSGSV